jgi:hypothetical protein
MAIICTRDGAATIWFLFAMFKIFFIVVVGWLRELLYVFEGMYVFNLASTCLAKGTHEEYSPQVWIIAPRCNTTPEANSCFSSFLGDRMNTNP